VSKCFLRGVSRRVASFSSCQTSCRLLAARGVGADLILRLRALLERQGGLRFSSDPILDPLLAERLLLTLAALGVPAEALPKMFQRAMGVIFEMISTVSGRSKPADQKTLSAQMNKAIVALADRVSDSDQLREALVAETFGASKPNSEVAALYADRLTSTFSPG
jgi:hypothetical protein